MEDWKYGRMKVFFIKHISLTVGCNPLFTSVPVYFTSRLPFFHTSILSKLFGGECVSAYLRGRFLKECLIKEWKVGVNKLLNEKFSRVGFRLYICRPNKNKQFLKTFWYQKNLGLNLRNNWSNR
jgi:hypothetical protein